jgi:hypothetical protein
MKTFVNKGLTMSVITLILTSSQCALRAEEKEQLKPEAAVTYKVADVAVVRPVAAGLTLAGGLLWLVSWPVTAASGDCNESYNVLVRKPANMAFGRKEGRNDKPAPSTKILKSPRSS